MILCFKRSLTKSTGHNEILIMCKWFTFHLSLSELHCDKLIYYNKQKCL